MKKIRNWFIGDLLSKTDDVFERARIETLFAFWIFFFLQGTLLYINIIASELWYQFYLITFAVIVMLAVLFILKYYQNIRIASLIWLGQFMVVATGNFIIQEGEASMMVGLWTILQILFSYFMLDRKWAVAGYLHAALLFLLIIINDHMKGRLLDFGIPDYKKLPEEPLVTIIPFVLNVFLVIKFVKAQREAQQKIKEQKYLIEEKNKDITDSINYAQRIQKAMLASAELLNKNLNDYFILFKPKDIVSGDFYWATEKDGRFYLAVCDSTGHGVPGAFMSLLNISFLNEAISQEKIIQPNEIFDHVRKRLIENISSDGAQDGMDGILFCFDKNKNEISYSAANNNPILISDSLIELEADKMPVGLGEKKNSFIHRSISFKPGSVLCFYTDGYADQFGGEKGKKFKYKQLNELLLTNRHRPLHEQKKILENTFESWKGSLEQVDDVLLVGIKL